MVDDGKLLLFTVDKLYAELLQLTASDDAHQCREDIESALEQCFYCLYGHPNKRAKAKHLNDHSANPVLSTCCN